MPRICALRSLLRSCWLLRVSYAFVSLYRLSYTSRLCAHVILVSVKWLPICCVPHLLLLACPLRPVTVTHHLFPESAECCVLPCAPTSFVFLLRRQFCLTGTSWCRLVLHFCPLAHFWTFCTCPCSHFLFLAAEFYNSCLMLSSVLCEDSYECVKFSSPRNRVSVQLPNLLCDWLIALQWLLPW